MLKQKFVVDFVAKIAVQILTAIAGIIVARMAGPEVVGTIAHATAYVSIFLFIPGLFGTAYIKIVAEGEDEEDALATYSWLMGAAVSFFFVIVLVTFSVDKFIYDSEFVGIASHYIIPIILSATILSSIIEYSQIVFVAKTQQAKANLPNVFKAMVENSLRILVVVLGYGIVALASVKIISALIVLPVVWRLVRSQNFGKFRADIALRHYRIALPLLVIVITNSLMMYSDKLVLDYYGNAEDIGIYTAAFSIGGMLILLGNTAGSVFLPLFSSLAANLKLDEIKIKVMQYERFLFLVIFPLIIALSLFSHPIIVTLLGIKYEDSAPILSLLVFSSFFSIWSIPYGNILSGLGLFWLSSLINGAKFLVFCFTLLLCIHPDILNLGAMSLAITQLTMNIFLFLAYYLMAFRKGAGHNMKVQSKFLFYGIMVYYVGYNCLIPNLSSLSISYQVFMGFPLFIIAVFAMQAIFGLMQISDIKFLLQIINVKSNYNYAKEEIKSDPYNE
jgi:O-antigen/teichoic acid export membrane protein